MRHVWWKGKVTHPPSVGENLYLSELTDTSFLPLFTDNTFTNRFQLDLSNIMYSRGKIFKGGELETKCMSCITPQVIHFKNITR